MKIGGQMRTFESIYFNKQFSRNLLNKNSHTHGKIIIEIYLIIFNIMDLANHHLILRPLIHLLHLIIGPHLTNLRLMLRLHLILHLGLTIVLHLHPSLLPLIHPNLRLLIPLIIHLLLQLPNHLLPHSFNFQSFFLLL